MLIQCTSCGAQATIPDSKEGAKVRCASCEHVYIARRLGAKGPKKEDPTKYFIIGGVVILAAVVITMATSSEPPAPPAPKEVVRLPPTVVIDDMGWDSLAVKLVRELHAAATAQNGTKLLEAIDGEAAYADWRGLELAANAEAIAEAAAANENVAEGVEPQPVPELRAIPAWEEFALADRNIFVAGLVEGMILKDDENHLSAWQPFSGSVLSMIDDTAMVRVQVSRIAGDQSESRTVEWRLVDRRSAGAPEARWRAAGWNRYFTPEELAAARRKKHKKTVKRTLEDGSFVIEGEIRVIPYEAEVPQAERDRIDKLIHDLVDFGSRPKVITAARAGLVAAGKPAIAPLLTYIANTVPIDTEEEAIRLGLVHSVLTDMTGYLTTYKPSVQLGTTEERMDSGLKQWFGWYDRKYKKYTGQPEPTEDPLFDDPDWQPRTERERSDFERARGEREGG